MYVLFAIPAVALIVILAVSLAPIFDFRARPLPGTMGTCVALPEPETAADAVPVIA